MAKNTSPSQSADKYILRFPDGMRDIISAAAKANNRTMNAEIISRIQSTLDAKPCTQISEIEAIQLAVREAVRDELKEILPKPKAK